MPSVPYYQPETAFEIFNRVMFNKDVATGNLDSTSEYSTTGPANASSIKTNATTTSERYCYLWDIMETCNSDEKAVISSGAAIVQNYILLGYNAANGTSVYYPNADGARTALMGANATGTATGNATKVGGSVPTASSGSAGHGSHRGAVLGPFIGLVLVFYLQCIS